MPIRQTAASLALLLEVTAALTAASLIVASPALAQPPPPAVSGAPIPPGTESPQAIVRALYAVISGPAGQKRDWARFKELAIPDARLVATRTLPDGSTRVRSYTIDQYIEGSSKAFDTQGFFETGETRDIHRNGPIATIVSPYASRHEPGGAPFAKGVNHFQLVNDGRRWFVVDIFWEDEALPPAPAKK